MITMSKILETVVIDKKKTWTENLSNDSKEFFVDLDDNVIDELLQKRELLDQHNIQHFTYLKIQIQHIKQAILIEGCGFCVINGANFTAFDKHELSNIHIIISKIFKFLILLFKKSVLLKKVTHNVKKTAAPTAIYWIKPKTSGKFSPPTM